jgi:hypothetical protein
VPTILSEAKIVGCRRIELSPASVALLSLLICTVRTG